MTPNGEFCGGVFCLIMLCGTLCGSVHYTSVVVEGGKLRGWSVARRAETFLIRSLATLKPIRTRKSGTDRLGRMSFSIYSNSCPKSYSWPTRSMEGFSASAPGCHLAGHTWSPYLATNCAAKSRRSSSAALRPIPPAFT